MTIKQVKLLTTVFFDKFWFSANVRDRIKNNLDTEIFDTVTKNPSVTTLHSIVEASIRETINDKTAIKKYLTKT